MSSVAKLVRFHDRGEAVNETVIEKYGYPLHSLYSTRRVISQKQEITVTDEEGRVLYRAESKPLSLLDKTKITDADGKVIARFERKKGSLMEKHILTMSSGMELMLEKEPFHLIKEITNIRNLNWQLRGNIKRLNFEMVDIYGQPVAVIGQKFVSREDKYSIDIYQDECEDVVACMLIILMHIVRDRNIKSTTKAVRNAVPK